MTASNRSGRRRTPSDEIDDIVEGTPGWKGTMLSHLRELILRADPAMVEEVKWKKPSNPEGVPVWSHDGIVCVGNVLKSAVRLTFPHGAQLNDPAKVFNTRLDSRAVRAIDFHEGEAVKERALSSLILAAVRVNRSEPRSRYRCHSPRG